jgi:hypothetical protein
MKRAGLVLFTLLSASVLGQPVVHVRSRVKAARPAPLGSPSAVHAGNPQDQRRDPWHEFLRKHFNRADLDYGAWLEQRRQAFLDASVHNPYFTYSAGVTFALMVVTLLLAKQRMDHQRSTWITAEMMTDLYNHDAYSRQVARHAIDQYNDHIELCNRAREAADHGMSVPGMESDVERLRSELQLVTEERDSYERERDLAKQELAEKERLLGEMCLRFDAAREKVGRIS